MAESVVLKVIHMFKNHHIGVTELTQHLVNILFILNTLMAAQAHLDMKNNSKETIRACLSEEVIFNLRGKENTEYLIQGSDLLGFSFFTLK